MGIVKLNWDASMDSSKKLIGVGVIARDHRGRVLAAKCSVHMYISDPAVAEAYGAREGAEFGCGFGFHAIILEGDAKEVVLALGKDNDGLGKFGWSYCGG